MLEKLVWISAFMLVGASYPGAKVGDVESQHTEEVCRLIRELYSAGAMKLGIADADDAAVLRYERRRRSGNTDSIYIYIYIFIYMLELAFTRPAAYVVSIYTVK